MRVLQDYRDIQICLSKLSLKSSCLAHDIEFTSHLKIAKLYKIYKLCKIINLYKDTVDLQSTLHFGVSVSTLAKFYSF